MSWVNPQPDVGSGPDAQALRNSLWSLQEWMKKLDGSTTTNTVGGTIAWSNALTTTIPAWSAPATYKLTAHGRWHNSSGVSRTQTYRIGWNGVYSTTPAYTIATNFATEGFWNLVVDLYCPSPTSQRFCANLFMNVGGVPVTDWFIETSGDGALTTYLATVDMTVPRTLNFQVQLSATAANFFHHTDAWNLLRVPA